MTRISKRSHVNVNNMSMYNGSDREMDRNTPTPPAPQSHRPHKATLRSRLSGNGPTHRGMRVSVQAGDKYLGMAISKRSLLALIEAGYLEADEVHITGTFGDEKMDYIVPEHEFDGFKQQVA